MSKWISAFCVIAFLGALVSVNSLIVTVGASFAATGEEGGTKDSESEDGAPVGDGLDFTFEIGDTDFRSLIITSFFVDVQTSDNVIPVQFGYDFCTVTSSEDEKTKTYSFTIPTAPEGHILLVKFLAKAKKNDKAWRTPYNVIGYIPMTDLKLTGELKTEDLIEIEKGGKPVMTAWGSYNPLKQWYHLDTNSEYEETPVFVHDFSENRNYGVVHGDAVVDEKGAQGRTFFLDGVNDYISVVNSNSINDIPTFTYAA